ncbi:Uncharacterised protein [Mycobacterium tuberculosis]|uniref:Uncharacterized protein n=1 Tax=Mycobacterium tuberculosis TaxID=1773 RepID=A0A0U0QV90_MYCTX|nr:Uncharacterised protein [Mycobacterium tuberculosis]COX15338.1 Uncharacterised protein [Mycobacterium tuberculosis]
MVEFHVLLPVQTGMLERGPRELTHGETAPGRQNEVVGLVGLQHPPHAFDVFGRVPPVADRIQIAHIDLGLDTGLDACHGPGDLSGHERLTAPR